MSSDSTKEFKGRLRNLLVEFGVEPFVLVGFNGQEDFDVFHARGSADLRSINDLFLEKYAEWFEPDEVEFDADFDWLNEEEQD
jgi:hypothetical protein